MDIDESISAQRRATEGKRGANLRQWVERGQGMEVLEVASPQFQGVAELLARVSVLVLVSVLVGLQEQLVAWLVLLVEWAEAEVCLGLQVLERAVRWVWVFVAATVWL
jgi:hypothetical protein